MLHQLDTGNFVNPGKLTVGDFLRQWLRDYAEAGVRATTREGYRIIVEKHLIPGMGHITLSQLQPSHLQSYYAKALKEGRSDGKGGLSARTVKHHHRVLSEALNHAMRWGLVGRNVALAVDPPRPVNKEMRILDGDGIHQLLEAARGTLYYPAIYLAVFSGMRRSEVLGLRWRDLDLDGSTLTVNQVLHVLPGGKVIFQEPKTDRSRRTITLGPSAVLALKAHRERAEADRAILGYHIGEEDLVFANPTGSPMLPNTLTHAFTKIARKAGLNVRLHDMRHSHVSMRIKQGIHDKAIADRVGHSSISTTMDIYGHLFSETQREAAIKFELGLAMPTAEDVKHTP
jgi:integrase